MNIWFKRAMSRHFNAALNEAAKAAGGIGPLSEKLGLSYQAVWKWRQIPAHQVIAIERLTGIPRERLRPDLYGAPRPRPRRRTAIEAAA